MPLPKPTSGESKDKFVSRCISEIYPKEFGQREAIAICYNIYEGKEAMNMKSESPFEKNQNEFLLKLAEAELRSKEIDAAKYDWDQCVSDMTERYGDEETANKVCGMIKSKYGGE